MPSTANTTAQLHGPGVPDYTTTLRDTPMFDVLARLRNRRESGALFVSRLRSGGNEERKDIYVDKGRLVHVATSDREDLLGQYLLRHKLITRAELDQALAQVRSFEGRLGQALIQLGLADGSVVARAVRNLGRDRVASITQPVRLLKGFRRVTVPAGGSVEVSLPLTFADLRFLGPDLTPTVEPGLFDVWLAPSAQAGEPAQFTLVR